jgi:hypothetical protein
MSKIAATYKARDVEEVVDIYFYRPMGYAIAVAAHRLGLTPNTITIVGMFFGVLGGHLFFYDDLTLNVLGILCWIIGQAMDGADGQLARMANMRSRLGRILDGLADGVKFVSVYFHLCLRIALATGAWWIFVIGALAGYFHSVQSALADFYRNAYLFFVIDPKKGELEKSQQLQAQYAALSWKSNFFEKLLLRLYTRYTARQERWAGNYYSLQRAAVARFGADLPAWLREAYRRLNRPLLKYYNALTTNTRMIVLYASLFLNQIALFFVFDLVVLNVVLLVAIVRQRRNNEVLIDAIGAQAPVSVAEEVSP